MLRFAQLSCNHVKCTRYSTSILDRNSTVECLQETFQVTVDSTKFPQLECSVSAAAELSELIRAAAASSFGFHYIEEQVLLAFKCQNLGF